MPPLRTIRRAQQLSQGRLAARAGLTGRTVGAIEAGRRPRPHTIKLLAAVLGVKPETIDESCGVLPPSPPDAPGAR